MFEAFSAIFEHLSMERMIFVEREKAPPVQTGGALDSDL